MTDVAQTLARLSALMGPPDGVAEPLDGGITNRNWKVGFAGSPYVIREPGRNTELLGTDRDSEWAASCAAARVGSGPPVRAMLENPPILVTGFVEGHPVTEEELTQPDVLRVAAGALRRMHDSGVQLPSSFSAFRIVEEYAATAEHRGARVPGDLGSARKRARAIEKALRGPEHEPVPCHNDLLANNLIVNGSGMQIVDWEYAGMGDRYFDLGNLAVNNGLGEEAEATFLEAYFGESADARRLACLRLMRYMSDLRESMWAAVQSVVSDVDFDFEAYAARHFERLRETAAHPDFNRWLKAARS